MVYLISGVGFVTSDEPDAEVRFNAIYDRYHRKVYQIAYTYLRNVDDAQDVTQIVFLTLFRQFQDLDTDNEKAFTSLLLTMTRNHAVNYIKKNQRESKKSALLIENIYVQYENDIANVVENEEAEQNLLRKIEQILTIQEYEIFDLAWQDLKPSQISRLLGLSANVVYRTLYRSRQKLNRLLRDNEGGDTGV